MDQRDGAADEGRMKNQTNHAKSGDPEKNPKWSGRGGAPAVTPGLYLRLAAGGYIIFVAVTALFCDLIVLPIRGLHPLAANGVLIALAAIAAACGLLFIAELLSLRRERDLLFFIPLAKRRAAFRIVYPICMRLGRLFGQSQDMVSASLIALINRLTHIAAKRGGDGCVLVLLPRCIQNSRCAQRVVEDIAHCRKCGKCDIARVIEMRDKFGFCMAVVGGGELARKKVQELSPSFVIAVACERELLEGIQGVSDIPVIGIPNKRPEGPCVNTVIDIEEFEKVVSRYARKRNS
jgi:uncharacterized protein